MGGLPVDNESLKAEYAAVSSYLNVTVTNRFQTAGLYMAASGFLAGAVFKSETAHVFRVIVCGFALVVTLCMWALEIRNRQVIGMIAGRAGEIEKIWLGDDSHSGFLSRQLRGSSKYSTNFSLFAMSVGDLPPFLRKATPFLNHSFAFDVLYASGLLLWAFCGLGTILRFAGM